MEISFRQTLSLSLNLLLNYLHFKFGNTALILLVIEALMQKFWVLFCHHSIHFGFRNLWQAEILCQNETWLLKDFFSCFFILKLFNHTITNVLILLVDQHRAWLDQGEKKCPSNKLLGRNYLQWCLTIGPWSWAPQFSRGVTLC